MEPQADKPEAQPDAAGATRLEPHSPTARSAFGPGNQPPANADQRLPASLQGRYQLLRLLGKGGFATVYLAHDSVLDQQVAIKILKLGMTSKSDEERFLREARIGARLRHPHIAQVYDIVLSPDGLQMIMEFCPGGTLADLIKSKGALKPQRAIQVARQVGQALAHAHQHQFIHRDVKPANVFFMNDGSIKLGDFGIAASVTSHEYTQTGMIIGTPIYMAPEQSSDSRDVDPRADIYSLGLTLYVMLTGHSPRVIDLDLVPPAFRSLIKHATCADRNQRMVSAEQFCATLDQIERELKEATQTKSKTSSFVVPPSGGTDSGAATIPPEGGTMGAAKPPQPSKPALLAKERKILLALMTLPAVILMLLLVLPKILKNTEKPADNNGTAQIIPKSTPTPLPTARPAAVATARAATPTPTPTPAPTPTPVPTALPPRSIAKGMRALLESNRTLNQAFDDFKNYKTSDPVLRQMTVGNDMKTIRNAIEQAKRSRQSDLPLLYLLAAYADFQIGLIDQAHDQVQAARNANDPLVQPYDFEDRAELGKIFDLDDNAMKQLYSIKQQEK